MHFHIDRRTLEDSIREDYEFKAQEAKRIADYMEASGDITFSGPMFTLRDPTSQDVKGIISLARGILGTGRGGIDSLYKVKEYLSFKLRQSAAYGRK